MAFHYRRTRIPTGSGTVTMMLHWSLQRNILHSVEKKHDAEEHEPTGQGTRQLSQKRSASQTRYTHANGACQRMDNAFLAPGQEKPPDAQSVVVTESTGPPSLSSDTTISAKSATSPSTVSALAPRSSRHRARHPINPVADAFRKKHFRSATVEQWNDWVWQLRNRIRTLRGLESMFRLSSDERAAVAGQGGVLPMAITPYYASLLDPDDPRQPLRRCTIPVIDEYIRTPGEELDPLGEDADSPVDCIVHRYPDRALFLVSNECAVNCRYCTRSRFVGGKGHRPRNLQMAWGRGIEYIRSTPAIRDVLVSGGDPLILSNDKIDWLLRELRAIPHVELIRIGTKAPVVMPQRITSDLTRMLKRHHPLWMSLHFTHPDELTPEVQKACGRLADAGIPLGSQTVLLSGVNDDADTMRSLMHGLVRSRVRPYYLYQCDPILGSSHFRTTVQKGLDIISALRGHTTGYAVPTYVIDAPGGGGKIPLLPETVVGRDGDDLLLRSYDGCIYRYPDPGDDSRRVAE